MLKKNIISSVFVQTIKLLLKFIVSIVVARNLGTTVYGEVTYFFLVFGIISSYGHLGTNNAISYFVNKSDVDKSYQFSANISYLIINSIVITIILIVFSSSGLILSDLPIYLIVIGMIYVISMYFFQCTEAFLIAEERLYVSNKCVSICTFIVSMVLFLMAYLKKINGLVYIILMTVEALILFISVYVLSGRKYKIYFSLDVIKKELKYGQIVFWAALFSTLNYRVDQIFIKKMCGLDELGIYSVAVSLAELIFLIPNSVNAAFYGKLLNLDLKRGDSRKLVSQIVKLCTYGTIIMGIFALICTPLISVVYGKEYNDAEGVFVVLLLGVCGASLAKVMYAYYMAIGKPIMHLLTTAMICVINVLFNLLLIPSYGMMGAAIASSFSYLCYGIMYILLYVIKEKFTFKELFFLTKEDKNYVRRLLKGIVNGKNTVCK